MAADTAMGGMVTTTAIHTTMGTATITAMQSPLAAATAAPARARGRTVSIPVVAQGHVHGPDCNHDH